MTPDMMPDMMPESVPVVPGYSTETNIQLISAQAGGL